MARVTIQDVADYADVSRATVSRVLNGNPQVDDLLRERVLAAVNTLGYQPNRAAQRLRRKSHDVIGLIVSDIQNPHFVAIIKDVEQAAYVNSMNVLLCNTGEDPRRMEKYLRIMRAESVAGLIVVPTDGSNSLETMLAIQQDGIPIVILDRVLPTLKADIVKTDGQQGGQQAARHLLEHGYHNIAVIYPDLSTGHERLSGYRQALQAAGIPIDEQLLYACGHRVEDSYQMTRRVLSEMPRPEALFTATNLMTLGALRAIRELELHVPTDIAIVGFDDVPWASVLGTSLTVVQQPTSMLGQEAVKMLLARLNNENRPYTVKELPPRLVVRESCGVHSQPL